MEYLTTGLIAILSSIASIFYCKNELKKKREGKIERKKQIAVYTGIALGYIAVGVLLLYGLQKQNYPYVKCLEFLVLVFGLLLCAWTDLRKRIIPTGVLMILLIIETVVLIAGFTRNAEEAKAALLSAAIGLFIGFCIMFLAAVVSKGAVGMGDVRLIAVVGYFVGTQFIFSCLLVSLLLSAVCGVVLMLLRKLNLKDSVPFGPFVAVGTALVLLFAL